MLAALLLATTLTWSDSLDEALQRAQSEKKLVVVYLRASESREVLNLKPDAVVDRAAANENIAYLMQSFVLVKTSVPGPFLRGQATPSLVVLDPHGLRVMTIDVRDEKGIAMALGALRERTPELVRASEARAKGKAARADVILGRELILLGLDVRAIKLLESAARELKREGDAGPAAYAKMWEGVGRFKTGSMTRGKDLIKAVARSDAPPEVLAEAWMWLGDIALQERVGRESFVLAKAVAEAIGHYRKAYEIAPAGSAILTRARAALESMDTEPLPPKGEQRTAGMRLIPPARRAMTGVAEFVVDADPEIARVELFLDDVPVASDDVRPFRVSIDVGPAAVMRTVKAAGLDASGERLAEAVVAVNDSEDSFRAAIVAPAEKMVHGPANVEVDVQPPASRKIERLELYWNQTPIATLHEPPFRQRFEFPSGFGYLRAVAVLDDGTQTEDARIYNGAGLSESVEVRAVTLLATVTDAHGKRVEGLTAADFTIEDERTPVVVNVQSTDDLPVTIGIAIDSSSSMSHRMFQALELATEFVRSGEGSNDRTFVVAFDEAPRMVHEISGDAESLRRAILSITPTGGTSIFDGVVFALQQFQNVPGRKALLVISDGGEVLSNASADAAIRTARAAAIPIYGVAPDNRWLGNAVQTLSEATGGIAFVMPRKVEVPAVFARIRDDVRGQYLLTFESHPAKPGAWRDVRVRTKRAGLKVRTVTGYYAR